MKVYRCVKDLQGGKWCVGFATTIEVWRWKAICQVEEEDFPEYKEIVKEIENLPQDKVIDFIACFWQLEFEDIGEISYEPFLYDSDIASFTLINKNGTKIFLRRASHSDGSGEFYVFEKERDLHNYLKKTDLKLDSFDMRIEEGWKAMRNDCAENYYDYGIQLHGNFIQIFKKGDTFYITLN